MVDKDILNSEDRKYMLEVFEKDRNAFIRYSNGDQYNYIK